MVTNAAVVIRKTSTYQGKQGPIYAGGVGAQSAGSRQLWMGRVEIPPGGRTKAHIHEHHETAILVLEGSCDMYTGDGLTAHDVATTGDYVYIPANVPHVAVNRGDRDCVAIIARTDPNEQESVVLLPELEARVP